MRDDAKVAAKFAQSAVSDRVVICPVTKGEVLYGIDRLPIGKKRDKFKILADAIFAPTPSEPISDDAADRCAQLRMQTELSGTPVADNDLWIAASAANLGATLV